MAILETHSSIVIPSHSKVNKFLETHVIHRHAVPTPNVWTVNVLAYQNIRVIRMQAAGQNVCSIPTVPEIGLVSVANVLIHVLEPVPKTPFAK